MHYGRLRELDGMMVEPLTESYRVERDKLLAQPCRCVSCPDCAGRGFVTGRGWDEFGEGVDDHCDYCSGSGISESCDRCNELDELEEAYGMD